VHEVAAALRCRRSETAFELGHALSALQNIFESQEVNSYNMKICPSVRMCELRFAAAQALALLPHLFVVQAAHTAPARGSQPPQAQQKVFCL